MEEAVADRIREGGVADEVVPLGDGKLTRHDGRARAVPVIEELQEVAAILRREGIEPEIIDGQHVDARELGEQAEVGAIGAGQGELVEQARGAADSARNPLRQACWAKAHPTNVLPVPVAPTTKRF